MTTRKLYELTPEHRARLPEWRDRWIDIICATQAMTDEERAGCREAVTGLYAAANLPPPRHVVFVPSPIVLAVAGGFAAAIWELRRRGATAGALTDVRAVVRAATWDATGDATSAATMAATWAATEAATEAATGDATSAATRAATWAATRAATEAATRDATMAATRDATEDATWAATRDATWDATRDATIEAARDATEASDTWYSNVAPIIRELALAIGGQHAPFPLACAARVGEGACWNGGNQWGQGVSYLTFFRYVAKLDLDYSKFAHYEYLAEHSGPRVMTPDFCMVSDRPAVLKRDEQNRPHCDDGPFCRWRDGFSLYAIHGVRVPEWLMMRPDMLTVERIHAEQNEEVRRVMIERYGIARYVRDAQFEVVDADVDPLGQPRRLLRRDSTLVVELTNSTVDADGTRRVYHIPVEPELRPLLPDGQLGAPQKLTALNAVASTFGMRGDEYRLEVET